MRGSLSVCFLFAVWILSIGAMAIGAEEQPIPLTVSFPTSVTIENGGKLSTHVVIANGSTRELSAAVEFLVQQDPSLYSKPAPRAFYGNDIALGVRSWGGDERRPFVESNDVWGRSNGKLRSIGAMTAGRPWNTFGTPWRKQSEAFGTLDLGKVVQVTHMTYDPSDPANAWKIDLAASLDGREYTPVEGLKGIDIHGRHESLEIDIPTPFKVRFIQMRLNNDGGEQVNAFRYPRQFHVYAGSTAETWVFPQVGAVVQQGKLAQAIPANGSITLEIGDGRARAAGAYLVAVRTKADGVTQLHYGHLFVMPAGMAKIVPDSPFGASAADPKGIPTLKLEGNASVRYEALRWSAVSPAPGVYTFDRNGGINQDSVLAAYHEAGLPMLACLAGTPSHLRPAATKPNDDPEATPPTDLSKYGEFVFQTVARYGSRKRAAEELLTKDKVSGLGYVSLYELWNHPNPDAHGASMWKGSLDDYYKLFRIGAEAAKKADPGVKIANGGWWGVEIPLMETMRTTRYPDGKCPLDFTDILSVQHFSSLGDIGSAYGIEPELATVYDLSHHHEGLPYERTIEDDLRALVAWRDAHKPNMPIWLTQAGFDRGNVSESLQACWLPRGVMMALAAGIDKVQISGETGTGAGGLMRQDGTLKPAWFTYATMVRQLDGVTPRALRLPADENVRAYLWKRGDKTVLTAWTIKGAGEFKAALGRCTLTDAFGASQPVDIRQALALSEFPVYVSDFADGAAPKALEEQGKALAEKEERRLERQSKLQAYLFRFGLKDREVYMRVGTIRKFTPVLAADLYDASKECGFETKGLADQQVPWFQNPITDTEVRATQGTRFTFKAKPGEYVLRLCARADSQAKATLLGLDGGDQAVEIPPEGMIATTTVKIGGKPVTLELLAGANLVWMSVIQVDNENGSPTPRAPTTSTSAFMATSPSPSHSRSPSAGKMPATAAAPQAQPRP